MHNSSLSNEVCAYKSAKNNYNVIVLSLLTKLFKSVTLYKSKGSKSHSLIAVGRKE